MKDKKILATFEIEELESNWNDVKYKTFKQLVKKHKLKGSENELWEVLSNHELNTCDFCEEIESTYDLAWLDGMYEEELIENNFDLKKVKKATSKGLVACCDYCRKKLLKKVLK